MSRGGLGATALAARLAGSLGIIRKVARVILLALAATALGCDFPLFIFIHTGESASAMVALVLARHMFLSASELTYKSIDRDRHYT